MKKAFFKSLSVVITLFITVLVFSCDSWMKDDDFFTNIEKEVKVANAPKINVYTRYALTRQGTTKPEGLDVFKVGIPHEISASTEPEYGFVRWAAFTTDYVGTGDNQSKNKNLYFIDEEHYKANFLPHELSSEVVSFEDAKNPNTSVTINDKRDDIFLVPIIAQRPTVALTIPSKGSEKVVRNMAVRISFSKPLDPESFYENGDKSKEIDKITVTQGLQSIAADGEIDVNSEDITDRFIIDDSIFSLNKKMITLKFKEEAISEGYASQASIKINISKEIKDKYGFTMVDDNEISFTTGSQFDTLAPRISYLTAGSGKSFQDFQGVYKDKDTIFNLGKYTKLTEEGATLIYNDDGKLIGVDNSFFDKHIANRIGKDSKLILRVWAEDLAGAGEGQSLVGIESDVTQIGIRYKHLYNSDGTEDTKSELSTPAYLGYVAQQNNTSSLTGTYRSLVSEANDALPEDVDKLDSLYGSLFEYDLSELPDGLIQLDVAAVDSVTNNGFFEGGEFSEEYGNAYASLFIVKDSTAPDAEANKNKVQADLSIVPNGRGIFNEEYYKRLAVVQTSNNPIVDQGHARLIAPNSELKWIVNPSSDTNWINTVTKDDKRWQPVTSRYQLSGNSMPAKDGPVDFTYALMDNLGNISKAVLFNSIIYDNTKPTLGGLKIEGINGYIGKSVTGNILKNQVLTIPVTDETAGLETIEIDVSCEKNGVTSPVYASPFAASELKVLVDGKEAGYQIDKNDGKKLIFNQPIVGTSNITIVGLQIADANNVVDDSKYNIKVAVTDAGINTSDVKSISIENDSTAPLVNYIKVKNTYNATADVTKADEAREYWSTETSPQTALYISITETNTGAKVFDFSGSTIKLRSDSKLTWNGEELPIKIDTNTNKLTITSDDKTIVTAAAGGELTITNVDLVAENAGENKVNLVVSDLVTNASAKADHFITHEGTSISSFKYDANTPLVNSVVLRNQANGAGGAAEAGFTNNEYVEATVNVSATAAGIYQITVSGASFDTRTQVNGKLSSDASEGFLVSADGSTITLKTSSNAVNRIKRGNFELKLTNVKLPAGDGDKAVSFTVTSLANRRSEVTDKAQTSIRLDKTSPAWDGDGVFVAPSNTSTDSIYPHSSTAASGNVKIGGSVYFYTKNTINIAASISETNRKNENVDLYIDGTGPFAEFTSVAAGPHTIYAVDKAGNKSAEKTFYVVGDATAPADFEGYVTFTMPNGGNIFRENAASANGYKNYVIKASASPYKLLVKLPGISSSDNDVHGAARTALSRYPELDCQTSASPIEYYAFSNDGSKNWQAIANGQISISLPTADKETAAPYTVYLKDGCGNEKSYTIPVNWLVDGSVTDSVKVLGNNLYVNEAKGINYYKGDTSPIFALNAFTDTCLYPNDSSVEEGVNKSTEKYTLKSRLLAWTGSGEPTKADFYSTSIDQSRFSDWSYLTLKQASSAATASMEHHYPRFTSTSAYKLYYIVEDKLGNVLIKQIVNTLNAHDNTLWMYDNNPPEITVETAGKINTITEENGEKINYYSTNSTLSLNMTDNQSGIEWDRTRHYEGNDVKNTLPAIVYSLADINPTDSFTIRIRDIKDFVGNVIPDTEVTVSSTAQWFKQTAPALSPSPVRVDNCLGSSSGTGGTPCGNGNYISEVFNDSETGGTGGKGISLKVPRSVTGVKVALNVTCEDDKELLGWRITDTPLAAQDIAADKFYDKSLVGTSLTRLTRNAAGEYEYTLDKSNTNLKWEDCSNKIKYFYAVNKAGLICPNPVIVKFVANPVPEINNRELIDVTTVSGVNVNFLKPSSTIKFTSDINITKCEFYKGNSTSPVLTVPDTANGYTLTESNSFTLNSTNLLSQFTSEDTLTVKLYTETEESAKSVLTDTDYASSNQWVYDPTAPEIKEIFVPGIKEGTIDGSAKEYWITSSTNKTDLFITLKEENSGVNLFDFAGSTIKLTSSSKLYKGDTNITAITVDTTANTLKINDYSQAIRDSSGEDVTVKITDVQLVSASSTTASSRPDNKVNLKVKDCSAQNSLVANKFALDSTTTVLDNSTTQITGFNYDAVAPTVTSYNSSNGFLRDRANLSEGGYAITPDPDFTNERYVNAQLKVNSSESGLYQLIVTGATFEASETNATTIVIDSTSVPFEISNDGHTATFTNNKVYKGTDLTVTINNLLLPEGENAKEVTVTVKNRGERSNALSDTITLDMTPPEWIGDGIYVSSSSISSKVYPHPISGGYAYGIMKGTSRYFYKGESNGTTLYLKGNVSDSNLPYNYLRLTNSSSPFAEQGFTNVSRTMFAFDKAGNKTENKAFTVVTDKVGPASVKDYITIKGATKDGATVGQVYRGAYGSTHKYIIQSFDANENVTPYKIIVKLDGVTAEDKKIDGSDYTAGSAYNELYKTTNDGSALSTFAAASKAPIEYFKVKVGSVESAWIPLLSDSPITTDVGALKVTNGSSITIDLPNVNCDTIGIYLKDGCGNESDVTLVAPDVTLEEGQTHPGLTWTVSNAIGDGNYEVEFNGTAYEAGGASNYVLINNPYTGSGTGGLAVNNGVTYYKKFSTSGTSAAPKLILKYKDECNLRENDDGYTLRARLIAGNWDTTPAYAQFSLDESTEEVTLTRKWASNWVEVKTPDPDTFGQMEFTFPDNTATAITGASATEPYELWYVVENAVGKSKIVQLKNRTSSGTSDVTKWMYDDQAPTLDIENDVSFEYVNKIDNTYYWNDNSGNTTNGTNSKATYTVRDAKSGLKGTGNAYITETKLVTSMSMYGSKPYVEMYDLLGNCSAYLYLTGNGTSWTRLNAPTLGSSRNSSFTSAGDTAATSASGRFYATETGSSSDGKTYSVMSARTRESITATLSIPSPTYYIGWVVSDSALDSTSLSAFYSSSTLKPTNSTTDEFREVTQSENTYTFNKDDTTSTWFSKFSGEKYFYAVNKAGLICQKPIIVKFAPNPIPAITDDGITYTNIVSGQDVNYIKSGKYTNDTSVSVDNPSSITFTSTEGITQFVLESGSISDGKTYSTAATSHTCTFNQNTWSALVDGEIKLKLSTATEDSDEITLTNNNISSWTYDATRPVFTVAINHNDESNTPSVKNPSGSTGTYYLKGDKARFAFSEASSDIAKYEYKAGNSWGDFESPYELDVSSETATSYVIRAIDNAGNISAEQTFNVQKDVIGPSGNVSLAYTHEGSADDSKIHEDEQTERDETTVIYNPSYATAVKLTASVSDAGAGHPSNYLYYKTGTKSGEEITWGEETAATDNEISVTLEADHIYYYEVYAKDSLGNTSKLHTYTFNGITPSATVTRALKNGTDDASTDYYYTPLNSDNDFYYNSAYVAKLAVSISNVTGNTVTLKSQVNDETPVEISDNEVLFDLPSTGNDLRATYKIIATDIVHNEKLLATYTVNGNAPTGSVVLDDTANDSSKVKTDSDGSTIYFNQSVENIKLKNGTEAPSDAGSQGVKIYYDKAVNGVSSGNLVDITDTYLLPCPGSDDGFTATYIIMIVDKAQNQTVANTYTLKGTSPSGTVNAAPLIGSLDNDVFTGKTPVSENKGVYTVGDYVLGKETNTEGAITAYLIDYNPSTVNTLKFAPVSVSDCGVGSKIVVKEGDNVISTVDYDDGVEVPVTLGSDEGCISGKIYDAYVVDNVGNAAKIMTYKFRAHSTAPAVPERGTAITYGGFDGEFASVKPDVKGIDNNNSYKIITENPKYILSKKPTGNSFYGMIGDTIQFSIPVSNADKLLSINDKKYVSYSLSYSYAETAIEGKSKDYTDASNITRDWTALQEITNNTITIDLRVEDVPCAQTYVFVWLKDVLGNTSVYSLTAPGQDKAYNWWFADTQGPTATYSYEFKGANWATLTEDTDYKKEVSDDGNTITLTYVKDAVKYIKISCAIVDSGSGYMKFMDGNTSHTGTNIDLTNDSINNNDPVPTENRTDTYIMIDRLNNTTILTVNYCPVDSLTGASSADPTEPADPADPPAENRFSRFVSNVFTRGETSNAEPIKTVQVFENHSFADDVVSFTENKKTDKKPAAKKTNSKKNASKKKSTVKAVEKITENISEKLVDQVPEVPEVQKLVEKVDAVEKSSITPSEIVSEKTVEKAEELVKQLEEKTEEKQETQLEAVTLALPEASVSPAMDEEAPLNKALVLAMLAAFVIIIAGIVFFVVKMAKKAE